MMFCKLCEICFTLFGQAGCPDDGVKAEEGGAGATGVGFAGGSTSTSTGATGGGACVVVVTAGGAAVAGGAGSGCPMCCLNCFMAATYPEIASLAVEASQPGA